MTTKCPLCASKKNRTLRDRVRDGVKRKVIQCASCDFVYLEPRDTADAYYTGPAYRAKHGPRHQRASSSKTRFDAYAPYQEPIIDSLRDVLRNDMAVLDVGCSTGQFLNALKGRVATRVGLELNAADVAFIRKNLDFIVHNEPIETARLEEGPFDIITALQVLEHVDRPVDFLRHLGRHLKKNGYLYLELPNVEDALLSEYQVPGYAAFYYREPHVSYFSRNTLASALSQAGFEGRIASVQRYSLLNHINWHLNGRPQPDFRVGNETPRLTRREGARARALNAFIERADTEYKALVVELGLGESLTFLGRKRHG